MRPAAPAAMWQNPFFATGPPQNNPRPCWTRQNTDLARVDNKRGLKHNRNSLKQCPANMGKCSLNAGLYNIWRGTFLKVGSQCGEKCERVSSGLMRAALMRFSQAAHCGLIEEIFPGTFRLLSRARGDQKSLLVSCGLF